MCDKSNVEFDYYKIKDVKRIYGIESKNTKSITITKSYRHVEGNEIKWDGTYDIDYDNITELNCIIRVTDNEDIDIRFTSGISLHGMYDDYELNESEDLLVIDAIINRVKTNNLFKDFVLEVYGHNYSIDEMLF